MSAPSVKDLNCLAQDRSAGSFIAIANSWSTVYLEQMQRAEGLSHEALYRITHVLLSRSGDTPLSQEAFNKRVAEGEALIAALTDRKVAQQKNLAKIDAEHKQAEQDLGLSESMLKRAEEIIRQNGALIASESAKQAKLQSALAKAQQRQRELEKRMGESSCVIC